MRKILPLLLCCAGCVVFQTRTSAGTDNNGEPESPVRLYRISPGTDLAVAKPDLWGDLKKSPGDYQTFLKTSFSKNNIPVLAAIAGSTALLLANDQRIYHNTVRQGRSINLSQEDKTTPFVKAWGFPLFRGPTDLGSAIYFMGDGWVTVGLISYFEISGALKDDWRAIRTAHDLMKGMLLAGITSQALKRITGRETPAAAVIPGGVWRFFPSTKDYSARQSRYDAFPSGHETNAMMTVTILAANYPESGFIAPLGYSLMAMLGFQMVNNGVHWASDYPLAIGIGYSVGKTVAAHGKTIITRSNSGGPPQTAVKFRPTILNDGTLAPGLTYRF